MSDPNLKACRNHQCRRKGQAIFVGDFPKPKCRICFSKLKPLHMPYDGPVLQYDPSEGGIVTVSNIISTDNKPLSLPASYLASKDNTDAKGFVHEVEWIKENTNWKCSCGEILQEYKDKELHLDLCVPGRKRHFTHYTRGPKGQITWDCWCGFSADNAKEGNAHDDPIVSSRDNLIGFHKKNDTFTCEATDGIKGCPIVKTPNLVIPMQMYATWKWMAMAFPTEWLAYLKGHYDAEGWHVTEMYIPKQKVTGTHVDVEDNQIEEGTIGDVHSHVNMNAFFSTEDERHFNHDVHLVINAAGNLATSIRVKLDCSRFTRMAASVFYTADEDTEFYANELRTKMAPDGKPVSKHN